MSFSFIQITDHHLGESEAQLLHRYSTATAFRQVLRHIAEHHADQIDFLISSGDLVDQPSETSYASAARIMQLQPKAPAPGPELISLEGLQNVPIYFQPGNHDDRDYFFRALFSQTAPMPLMNVSFEHKGIQFICLDWGTQNGAIVYPETIEFLSSCLQSSMPAILLTHHQLVPLGSRWLDAFLPPDMQHFWQLVSSHNILGIFSGHTHITYEQRVGNIPVYGLRSTSLQFALQDELLFCVQPLQYRLVTIEDERLTTSICELPW